ncbi:hypothetical protein JCM10908_001685 [Rhodotorula pacifica]|uniref:Eaf1p n=1 Tax=Rhodotorula pacifica TaxID=1495444 RepID=UPI00316EBC7C
MARTTASTSGHVGDETNSSKPTDYAGLRTRAIRAREAKQEALAATRHGQMAELYTAVRDKPKYTDFEAGLSGRKRRRLVDGVKHDPTALPGLQEFEQEYLTAESLLRLDISLPPLSPPPDNQKDGTAPREANKVIAPPLADDLAAKDVVVDDSEEDAEGEADEDVSMAAPTPAEPLAGGTQPGRLATTMTQHAPAQSTSAPQLAFTAPSASPSAAPSPSPSVSAPPPPAQTIAPNLLQPKASPQPSPSPAVPDVPYLPTPAYSSQFGIHEISSDYTDALPPVPNDVLRQRLNAALMLRTKKTSKSSAAQSVQPDLYKLHVRAQHLSAKSFLGPGKRVHNALGTSEWEVGIDEMRAIRAFERIEELKAEKAWSFRQPKKQRTGVVPEAHWDHVLDEMRWMQTDFRQERRWKIVTAYTVARDCRAYVRATPSARSKLVIATRPPRRLSDAEVEARISGNIDPTATEVGISAMSDAPSPGRRQEEKEADENDQDADGEPDVEASNEPGVIVTAASSSEAVKTAPPVASAPAGAGKAGGSAGDEAAVTTTATPSRSQAEANRAHSQAQHIQNLITFRNPIFDASPAETTISASELALIRDSASGDKVEPVEDDPFLGYDFSVLFPDLPLYSDFAIANDPTLARRVEDSSAWSGRLAQVTRLLEVKPTLISTLQPGRTRRASGWSPALVDALEDVKDSMSTGEVPVQTSASSLFAGRKPKDVAVGELLVKPQEVPHADIRATAILWLPEEDALLLALQKQYGLNWSLIAQVFNSTTHRPESDFRLAWDIYDRWDKLVGPGSKKLLPDGTEIVRPPPEWLPPVDRTGRPVPIIADGSKKKTRHAMIVEAMKKVQKKRELYAAKQPATGFPRRINMNMHESHNIPPRPNWTPMEWSIYKAEQEAQKLRLRQQQQAQAQAAAAMRQQQAQQNMAGLQQTRPPSSLPPQIAAAQAAARASPTASSATLPGSPSTGHAQVGISGSPRNMPQQLAGHVQSQLTQLTAEQLAALQARQQELLQARAQAQAQAVAAQRAAAAQQQQQQQQAMGS